ncbi:MAG: small ribosomal subunit biogenesis GTPase RsgA [Geitlerinemataceae cyanobacterium]
MTAAKLDGRELDPMRVMGTVLAVQANFYKVQLDAKGDPDNGAADPAYLLCTRRSRLKKIGQRVMVGDRAVVEAIDWEDGRGAISEVLPRNTELDRPPIANAEQILLVFAFADPPLEPYQLSRFLIKAESTGLNVCLSLNKCDLVSAEDRQHWLSRLSSWGYRPMAIGVSSGTGFAELARSLDGVISVVSGPSGVGKSSLINHLIPGVELRVSQVSGKLGRGRHTTRHVELFEMATGGLLADTPGFNQPEIDCSPTELVHYFPEARQRLAQGKCQFNDCLHREEPNCVVAGDWERYEHYLTFLGEAIARQEALQQLGERETKLKLKMKRDGRQQYEPKLASNKYRRQSRRHQHQSLQDLCEDIEDT